MSDRITVEPPVEVTRHQVEVRIMTTEGGGKPREIGIAVHCNECGTTETLTMQLFHAPQLLSALSNVLAHEGIPASSPPVFKALADVSKLTDDTIKDALYRKRKH